MDKAAEFCIHEIKMAKGQVSVEVLADKAGISNRQLVRRFDKCIGLSPKEFYTGMIFFARICEALCCSYLVLYFQRRKNHCKYCSFIQLTRNANLSSQKDS